jgi:hypothetical protein
VAKWVLSDISHLAAFPIMRYTTLRWIVYKWSLATSSTGRLVVGNMHASTPSGQGVRITFIGPISRSSFAPTAAACLFLFRYRPSCASPYRPQAATPTKAFKQRINAFLDQIKNLGVGPLEIGDSENIQFHDFKHVKVDKVGTL